MKAIRAKLILTLLSCTILLLASTGTWADCLYNGTVYPEGAVLKGKICITGQWVKN